MFFIFFTFYFFFNASKVTDTLVAFAKIIKEDQNATAAFRAVQASTFDECDPDNVVA